MKDIQETGIREGSIEDGRPPRKKGRLIFNIVLCVVIVLLLVAIFSPVRETVINHFRVAVPTPTVGDGGNLLNISASPLGTVTIDGHAIKSTAILNAPHYTKRPIVLARGRHKIMWQAGPFLPLSCVISVPPQANEQCPYESSGFYTDAPSSRLIAFSATMADLPAPQQVALKKAIQGTLDTLQATEMVQPGEAYAYAAGSGLVTTRIATEPLEATLHVTLDTNAAAKRSCNDGYSDVCTSNGENCLQLCTNTNVQVMQTKNGLTWDITALYYNTWTYTTRYGQTVAQNQPDSTSPAVGQDHSIELHVTWDSKGWHVSTHSYTGVLYFTPGLTFANVPASSNPVAPACSSIHNLVNATDAPNYGVYGTPSSGAVAYGTTQSNPPINVDWGYTVGTNEAAGCLGVVVPAPNSDGMPVNFKQPRAYFLYRFGVLVAVNALAHKYFPGVPMADGYEQGVAQGIVGRVKY